jgi:hypothetical protein
MPRGWLPHKRRLKFGCPKGPVRNAEDKANVEQLPVMSTRIPPELTRIAADWRPTPPVSDQPVARQRGCRKKVPFLKELSATSRVLHRTKGATGAHPGPRKLGLHNERTKARGTAKSDGSRGDPEEKAPGETGQTRSRRASPSRPAVARHVRRGCEPRCPRPV